MSQPDPRQQCIQEYRQRMSKLFEDKKFISIKLLRNTHEIAMESSMKSVERDGKPDRSAEELEMLINQELNKIVEQVMEINYGWGKNFVESQFGLIENRLKSKELKLVSSIKGEFNLFIEYFHKKVEPLGCKKLEYFFEEFIIEKAFDYSTYVYETERRSNQQELTVVKSKLAQKESEIKQLKRQISRQSLQALKTVENLQQSITYHKNRSQLLQSTITQLKSDRQTSQLEHESKLQSLQSQFLSSFTQHKEQKSVLSEELSAAKRTITVLESQIQKERQMHRQTHQHYKAMLQEFKIREDELKEEISDITMRASQEIQDYKRDTERSLNRSSVCRSQQEKEGIKLNQQLAEMNRKYDELQKAYSNLEYQMQLKKTQQEIARNDLEIALKLAEQRVCQYESRLPRYKKFQSELESYQKLHEEFTNQQKESQKQTALLRQQNTFILQQLKQLQGKYEGERRHSADCKKQYEELQEKVEKMNKVKVNEWVQTEGEGKLGEMLQQALKVVEVLEVEYGKVKAENARLRYKLHQY